MASKRTKIKTIESKTPSEEKIDYFLKATMILSSLEGVVVDMEVFGGEIAKFEALRKAMQDVDYATAYNHADSASVMSILQKIDEAITKLDVLRKGFTKMSAFRDVHANMNAIAREIDAIEYLGEQFSLVSGAPHW